MPCEEKSRLLDLYKARVAAHSAAVDDMTLARENIETGIRTHLGSSREGLLRQRSGT